MLVRTSHWNKSYFFDIAFSEKFMTSTIIFTHGGGRFANQIFTYAHLIAFALEHEIHDIDFVNVSFWEYAELLTETTEDSLCTWQHQPHKHRWLQSIQFFCDRWKLKNGHSLKRFLIFLLYLYGGTPLAQLFQAQAIAAVPQDFLLADKCPTFNLAHQADADRLLKYRVSFLSGWEFSDWQLVKVHQARIRHHLRINPNYAAIGQKFIAAQRENHDFLIGVMLRQGDYRTWENGRHFFTPAQYADWMKQMTEIFAERGSIGFVIASDEPQQLETFAGLDVAFSTGIAGASGHYIESMVELSLCDVIMTPASTFAMWAAFLGEVPIMPLYQYDRALRITDLLQDHLFGMLHHPGFR